MDDKNGVNIKVESGNENGDWRTGMGAELRFKVVEKIIEMLKKRLGGSHSNHNHRIKEIARELEDKIFRSAPTKEIYLALISSKLRKLDEQKHQPVTASSSASGLSQNSQSVETKSSLHNTFHLLDEFSLRPGGQDTDFNICKIERGDAESAPQPSRLNYHEKKTSPTSSLGQLSRQQSNATTLRQNQQVDLKQKLSVVPKKVDFLTEHPQNPHSNFSQVQNLQQMGGSQPNALDLRSWRQPSAQMFEGKIVSGAQKFFQKTPQKVNFDQVLGSQKQSVSSLVNIEQKVPTTAALHQPQSVIDHQKLFQSQRVRNRVSSASLESMDSSELAKKEDDNERVYQKIQCLKNQYMHLLEDFCQKLKSNYEKEARVDLHEKIKKHLLIIRRYIKFLSMPKVDLMRFPKETIDNYANSIIRHFSSRMNKYPASNLQLGGVQTPIAQMQTSGDVKQLSSLNSPLTNNVTTQTATELKNPNLQRNPLIMLQHEVRQNIASASPDIFRSNKLNASEDPIAQPQQRKVHLQPNEVRQNIASASPDIFRSNKLNASEDPIAQPQQRKVHLQPKQQGLMQNNHVVKKPLNYSPNLKLLPPKSGQKEARPLATIPLTTASLSTSVIPYPTLAAHAMQCFGDSQLPAADKVINCQLSLSLADQMQAADQSLSIGKSDLSPSQLLTGVAGPDTKNPIDRLIKLVKCMPRKRLSTAVNEILSVINEVDMIPDIVFGSDSTSAIGDDLLGHDMDVEDTSSQNNCSLSNMITRNITVSPYRCEFGAVNQPSNLVHELNSSTELKAKRQRIECRNPLLDEVRLINDKLVETMMYIMDSVEGSQRTIVRCCYVPAVISRDFERQVSSEWSMFPLVLIVPDNYPNSSPIILDESSTVSKSEDGNIIAKAKERFRTSLCKLQEPVSLLEMARTWDTCARALFSEYVRQFGGKSFSSVYGSPEDCLSGA